MVTIGTSSSLFGPQQNIGGLASGLDTKQLGDILVERRDALYPETVTIDLDASQRVAQSLVAGGLIKPDANISGLHDTTIAGG